MFIRKSFAAFLELWSEAARLVETEAESVMDWRWLSNGEEEEATLISERALIH